MWTLTPNTDLVWSDPEDVDTWAMSPRGAGWLFGAKVTNEVCSSLISVLEIKRIVGFLRFAPTGFESGDAINI